VTDAPALFAFQHRPERLELVAPSWPNVLKADGSIPIWRLLSQSVAQPALRRQTWLLVEGNRIQGVLVARARCGGLVWDITHLQVAASRTAAALELLAHCAEQAVRYGVRKIFLETALDDEGMQLARSAGFRQYTEAKLFLLGEPAAVDKRDQFGARPRLRCDEQPLFHLYTAAVPAAVRAAEAMTYEEWAALHKGPRRWSPSLLGDRHQYVWELGPGLAGWMEITFGQQSQHLEMLVDPRHEGLCDRMVRYALSEMSDRAPIFATVRSYQDALQRSLTRLGFEPAAESAVNVRQLAVQVREPALAPARARAVTTARG